MDPNACLQEIRELGEQIRNGDVRESVIEDYTSAVIALDEWLTRGGFLPGAWPKQTEPDLPTARWEGRELVCGHDGCPAVIDTMTERGYERRWDVEFRGARRIIANTNDDFGDDGDGDYRLNCARRHVNRLPDQQADVEQIVWR